MDGHWPLPAHRRRRFSIHALIICLLAAVLVAGPEAEAAGLSGGKLCAKQQRGKKVRGEAKRKGKRGKACLHPVAPPPAAVPTPPTATPTVPTRPTSTEPLHGPCGAPIPKGAGEHWECTFADDFSGTGLNPSDWVAQRTDTSGYQNGPTACFVADPDNIAVSGGTLKLTAREESEPFTCHSPFGDFETEYTSGMVSTWDRFSQTFGRFEIRARITDAQVKGLQSALWLWPVDATRYGPWPASGEIDIAEMYSQYPDRAVPYIHYETESAEESANVTNTSCFIPDLDEFHTYAVEWTSSGARVIYDGETCLMHVWDPASPLVSPQPFDQPFLVILTQALGVGTNEFDPATTPLPATTEVDYVRVWE